MYKANENVRRLKPMAICVIHQKAFRSKYFSLSHITEPTVSMEVKGNLHISINAGEGVEKREPSYTVGGNAN